MSEIIKIPLGGGFNKQSDPNLVGVGFIELINVHNLQKGVFQTRKGYGVPVEIASRTFLDIGWWIEPISGTLYWIGYDYDSSDQIFRVDNAFANNVDLESITNAPARVHIYNYGNAVRIAKGIEHNASVYQKIDRNYCNLGLSYLHWQFSAELDQGEKITLIDTAGISKIYKSLTGANHLEFTGANYGGAGAYIEITSTTIVGLIYTIIGLKSDDSTLTKSYKFDATEITGDADETYTYINTTGASGASVSALATEFAIAINSYAGHNGLINTNVQAGSVYMKQSIAGEDGETDITESGSNTGSGNINGAGDNVFEGGSDVEENDVIVVVHHSDAPSGSTDNTPAEMATEFKTAIESSGGHNGSLAVTVGVASDGGTALTGGVYVKQLDYNSIVGTTATLSSGFTDDCTLNPNGVDNGATSATFTTGIGFTFDDFKYDAINYPRLEGITFTSGEVVAGGLLPFVSNSRNIHYKIAPLFDGVQEGRMSSDIVGPLATDEGDSTNTCKFNISIDSTTFNTRCTGLNVYRAMTTGEYPGDGDYYFVKGIDLTQGASSGWVSTNEGNKGRRIISGWYDNEFSNNYPPASKYQSSRTWSVYNCASDGAITTGVTEYTARPVQKYDRWMNGNTFTGTIFGGSGSIPGALDGNNHIDGGTWSVDDVTTLGTLYLGGSVVTVTDYGTNRGIESVHGGYAVLTMPGKYDYFNSDRHWTILSENWFETNDPVLLGRGALTSIGRCEGTGGIDFIDTDGGTYDDMTAEPREEDLTVPQGDRTDSDWANRADENLGEGYFRCANDGGHDTITATWWEMTEPFTGFQGGELFYFAMQFRVYGVFADDSSMWNEIEDWSTGSGSGSHIRIGDVYDRSSSVQSFWNTIKIPDTWTAFKLRCRVTQEGDTGFAHIYHMILAEFLREGQKAWNHQSMFGVPDEDWADDSIVGKVADIDGTDYSVSDNIGNVGRVSGDTGWDDLTLEESTNISINGRDQIWLKSGTTFTTTFIDSKLGNGPTSPISGVTSLDTRYKVSGTVNGRTFAGNVKLFDDAGESNTYDDMIIYSELQQPDVLPISNFIKLNDLQGGSIVAIAGLMADLVVFAERGIFRLNVPSSDPTSWSLVESEPNLGCTQPYSIKQWKNGVFFAGLDNIYYITSNFEFISITENWRDVYQSNITDTTDTNQTVIEIDNNNERLLVKYGSEDEAINIMDLNAFQQQKLIWYEYGSRSGQATDEGKIESLAVRNDSKVYIINIASGVNTKIRELNPSSQQGTSAYFIRTGYISLSSMTDKEDLFIRRVNFNLQSDDHGECSITIYLNHRYNSDNTPDVSGGQSITKNVTPSVSGKDNVYSIRIGRRAKGFQLYLRPTTFGDDTTVLRELEVEVD